MLPDYSYIYESEKNHQNGYHMPPFLTFDGKMFLFFQIGQLFKIDNSFYQQRLVLPKCNENLESIGQSMKKW